MHDVWEKASTKHNRFLTMKIDTILTKKVRGHNLKEAQDFIKRNEDYILSTGKLDLRSCIDDFLQNYDIIQQANMNNIFKSVFSYDNFIVKKKSWWAYDLCRRLKYEICPYCHITPIPQYEINTPDQFGKYPNKNQRPELDHFYDKGRFPFLALTLGNLIPCCNECNCKLKHDEDFYKNQHLNPLRDLELIKFDLDFNYEISKNGLNLLRPKIIEPHKTISHNSVKTFNLETRYNTRADVANSVYSICRSILGRSHTNLSVINITMQDYVSLGINISIPFSYKNTALGKLRKDIIETHLLSTPITNSQTIQPTKQSILKHRKRQFIKKR
ncbi:hypothetical protein [Aquitalea pelogenes]|uniref:hypothetical protein n=1 Tax=Aquitalea pelogenes TaxID=1293573 RepID=UPI0035B2238A